MSPKQLSHFRLLTANDDHLKNNFRPTQPLNDRIVYRNEPSINSLTMPFSSIPFVDADNAADGLACSAFSAMFAGIGCLLFSLSRTAF